MFGRKRKCPGWHRCHNGTKLKIGDNVRHSLSKQIGIVVEIYATDLKVDVRHYINPLNNKKMVQGACSFHGAYYREMIEEADSDGYYIKKFFVSELDLKLGCISKT